VADQLAVTPRSQQEPAVAGLEEAAEEVGVARVVGRVLAVEALVRGDQRQDALEVLGRDRSDDDGSGRAYAASSPRSISRSVRMASLR
jgi:hypothetical protein